MLRSAFVIAVFFSLCVSCAQAAEVRAQPLAVVELFTSQGCSSCPAADDLLAELDGRDDIIALGYHVDYWDYIGWADTFGSPEFSDFQRAYSASWGTNRIYTPQMVINGQDDVVGSRRHEVSGALRTASLDVPVQLRADMDYLEVEIDGRAGLEEAVVWLITFRDWAEVAIERGENRGRTVGYAQIVTGRQVLGMWEPDSGAQLRLPLADVLGQDSNGLAIVVQAERGGLPGRILGAASFVR
jgi:hypothetical protein